MPGGYRWMYYMTGLPGWMRLGFSPGWVGVSPTGLGPTAQYLTTGTWPTPQMQAYWQSFQAGQVPYYGNPAATPWAMPMGYPQVNPAQELNYLKQQQEILEDQLEGIKGRIKELEAKK